MANVRIKDLSTTASTTASDDFFGVDGATNGTRKLNAYSPTFGGNLTVSGTGTSSVAGTWLVGTTTDNSATLAVNRSGTGPANSGSTSTAAIRAVDVSNDLALDIGVNSGVSPYPGWIQVHGRTNQATNYPLSLNPNGGVVLVNTSANSGNGAVQLATHTTSAGGIGFGTDLSLYRVDNSRLGLRSDSGTSTLGFYEGTTYTGQIGASSGGLYIDNARNSQSIIFRTSASLTTALTLDSSQNATFAGSIAIGNTVAAAVGVASTHKVTISIGGSTYYLLATNV